MIFSQIQCTICLINNYPCKFRGLLFLTNLWLLPPSPPLLLLLHEVPLVLLLPPPPGVGVCAGVGVPAVPVAVAPDVGGSADGGAGHQVVQAVNLDK